MFEGEKSMRKRKIKASVDTHTDFFFLRKIITTGDGNRKSNQKINFLEGFGIFKEAFYFTAWESESVFKVLQF